MVLIVLLLLLLLLLLSSSAASSSVATMVAATFVRPPPAAFAFGLVFLDPADPHAELVLPLQRVAVAATSVSFLFFFFYPSLSLSHPPPCWLTCLSRSNPTKTRIVDFASEVKITQHYENDGDDPIEACVSPLLSPLAFPFFLPLLSHPARVSPTPNEKKAQHAQ
jgi:hypothetical protein